MDIGCQAYPETEEKEVQVTVLTNDFEVQVNEVDIIDRSNASIPIEDISGANASEYEEENINANNQFIMSIDFKEEKINNLNIKKEISDKSIHSRLQESTRSLDSQENFDNYFLTQAKFNPKKRQGIIKRSHRTLYKPTAFVNIQINAVLEIIDKSSESFYISANRLHQVCGFILKNVLNLKDRRDLFLIAFDYFYVRSGKNKYTMLMVKNFCGYCKKKELKSFDKIELVKNFLPYKMINSIGVIKNYFSYLFSIFTD